ncbi:MAG: hypothetical protein Ta2F_18230 [Termitinemataceae bacterium]|nr:MAG: hypothetical protein Ta2F_18230 [Termitinemataceae bacterium]
MADVNNVVEDHNYQVIWESENDNAAPTLRFGMDSVKQAVSFMDELKSPINVMKEFREIDNNGKLIKNIDLNIIKEFIEEIKNEQKIDNPELSKWLFRGGTEWDNDGKVGYNPDVPIEKKHRVYFNGMALINLYGIRTNGIKELTLEENEKYEKQYRTEYLPNFPLEAKQFGKNIEPAAAFAMLCSKPYFDVITGKFVGLEGKTFDESRIEKYTALGGREWKNDTDFKHRIYFNGAALKNILGMETKGNVELSSEESAKFKEQYNVKFLPVFPAEATLCGEPIAPQDAFEILLSKPYYDVHRASMIGLVTETLEQHVAKNIDKDLSPEAREKLETLIANYETTIEYGISKLETIKEIQVQKEMTAPQQLKYLLEKDFENGILPWQKENEPREPVYNPVTGEILGGNNFIAAALHMENIHSDDPRYVRQEDINNTSLKETATPLKVCYRTQDAQGEYQFKTETLYNAKDIKNAPQYIKPETTETSFIASQKADTPQEQFGNDMSAFMTAIQTGKGFKPSITTFTKEDYSFIKSETTTNLFSAIHQADKKFLASLEPQVNVESKLELQTADYDR